MKKKFPKEEKSKQIDKKSTLYERRMDYTKITQKRRQ
jgi:hypothetical protein